MGALFIRKNACPAVSGVRKSGCCEMIRTSETGHLGSIYIQDSHRIRAMIPCVPDQMIWSMRHGRSGTNCPTHNGGGSKACSLASLAIPAAPPWTIVSSSTVSCGCCALARTGMTRRSDMANGKGVRTRFARWAKSGLGTHVFNVLTKTGRTNTSCSILRWFVPTSRPRPERGTKTRLWGDPEED